MHGGRWLGATAGDRTRTTTGIGKAAYENADRGSWWRQRVHLSLRFDEVYDFVEHDLVPKQAACK
jgi:hypothetical protein